MAKSKGWLCLVGYHGLLTRLVLFVLVHVFLPKISCKRNHLYASTTSVHFHMLAPGIGFIVQEVWHFVDGLY